MKEEKLFDAEGLTSSERYFYSASGFAKKQLSYVQEAGSLKSLKPHASVREKLDSYLFFMVHSGSGCVRCEGKQEELKAGDAVFLDCHKHYEHESSEADPWELSWVHFNGEKVKALYPLFEKSAKGELRLKLGRYRADVEEILSTLIAAKGENSLHAEIKADTLLSQLLCICMELAGDEKNNAVDFEGLREALTAGLNEPAVDIGKLKSSLEEKYGAPLEQIDAAFSARYGISIEGYAANRMLNKAKELLRFTIEPLAVVAKQSGLGDEEALRSLFLENEEMSPEDYRKKWAQWIKG